MEPLEATTEVTTALTTTEEEPFVPVVEWLKRTSHSMLELFKECPLHGFFKYIGSLEPELKFKDGAFVGKYFHDNCVPPWFQYYEDVDIKGIVDPATHFSMTMTDIYLQKSDTIENPEDDETIVLCLNNFVNFMVKRLAYVNKLKMPDAFLPVSYEREYEGVINGVPIHGYIDADFQDIKRWLIDWKTNKDPAIPLKYVRQATRYVMLIELEEQPKTPIDEFYMLNVRIPIDTHKGRLPITEKMKKEQETEMAEVWKLVHCKDYPKAQNKKTGGCYFCEYKLRCSAYPKSGVQYDPARSFSPFDQDDAHDQTKIFSAFDQDGSIIEANFEELVDGALMNVPTQMAQSAWDTVEKLTADAFSEPAAPKNCFTGMPEVVLPDVEVKRPALPTPEVKKPVQTEDFDVEDISEWL